MGNSFDKCIFGYEDDMNYNNIYKITSKKEENYIENSIDNYMLNHNKKIKEDLNLNTENDYIIIDN